MPIAIKKTVMLMRKFQLTVSFLAIVAFALFTSVNAQNRQVVAEAQRVTGDVFTVAALTPKGANIYAVRQPSAAMLDAIDKGLTDLFAVARKNGYSRRLNYADYSVFIAN